MNDGSYIIQLRMIAFAFKKLRETVDIKIKKSPPDKLVGSCDY